MRTVNKGLRLVAVLEAFKGLISLCVGLGLHVLAGHNLRQFAESIVSHAHLNPASHLPSIFINALGHLSDSNLMLLALGAFLYSLVRLVEAYGLWYALVWTEWFALISGAIYVPFELYELFHHTSVLGVSVLFVNLVIVGYMAHMLFAKEESRST